MRRKILAAAMAGQMVVGGAHAQLTGDEERVESTIIVTAPGPDRSAAELVGNATSIERDEILQTLSSTLGDSLDREPGVATTFFGQGASRPVLRGLGAERVQVLTNGIGVIDASAASPDHQVGADGIDSEKIEILRGPAALVYGGQAIGGVVNVIDGLIAEDIPHVPMSGDLFAAYNSVNEGTELAGRGQFVAGPFVLALSASQRDFGDYEIPGFAESALLHSMEVGDHDEHEDDEHDGEEHDDQDGEAYGLLENSFLETETLSAGLSWVGDGAFFGVAVRQQTAQYGLPGHEHHHEEEHDEEDDHEDEEHEDHAEEENPFIDLKQTRIDLRSGISINNGFLTDVTAALSIVDYEHAEFEAPGEIGTQYTSEGVEGRVEFDHSLNGLDGAFGVQYLSKNFDADGAEAFISETDTESLGIFLYETSEWDNGAGIEGGLRFENISYDNAEFGSVDFDLFGASLGLHNHTDTGVFIGAQLSYTERAPSESELFAFGAHLATEQFEIGDPTLDKESGVNLEGTARWRGDNGGIGISVFATSFSDFTYLAPAEAVIEGVLQDEHDELPVFLVLQDDATFYGGEVYADYTLEDGPFGADWLFDASLDLVQAELDAGGDVPFIPPVTLNTGAAARWNALELGAAVTMADNQSDAGAGQLITDGYTTLDLRAEYDVSQFGIGKQGAVVFVEARNVTDEVVRYATSVLKDVAPAPGQNIRAGVRFVF
ncbi:MAG: TonB-dependent receptor [Hyphomonas sp.]